MPEISEWRLLFASPELPVSGPQAVYRQIAEAHQGLGETAEPAPMSVIGLLDPEDELVRLLQTALKISSSVSRIRYSKSAINGHFIEDALIYRLAPPRAA